MVPVYPYLIRRSNTGSGGEMLLSLPICMDSFPILREDRLEPVHAGDAEHEEVPLPDVFRDVIESLVLPSTLEDEQANEGGF